jgi:aspartyl-tRNA(Asn)/glutamyl-tRNA(Gln) amidotransferase subunit C
MSLSQDEVAKIATLARIELTKEEDQKLATELSAVVDFVETLNQAPTDNGFSTALEVKDRVGELENVMRNDEIAESLTAQKVLQNAPNKKDNYILVKKVFE